MEENTEVSRRAVLRGLASACAVSGAGASVVAAREDKLTTEEKTKAKRLLNRLRRTESPEQVFEALKKSEKQLVRRALRTEKIGIDASSPIGTLDSGKRVTATYTGTNTISGDLWSYTGEVQWKYDGSTVTEVERTTAFGETYEVGWQYNGIENEDQIGNAGDSSITYTTEGLFKLCFQFCGQSASPVIEIDAYGNGTWSADRRTI